MSLIVPGGRPTAPSGPVPVDFAFIVATQTWGDVVILDPAADIDVQREAQPDDIYGAITLVVADGPDLVLDPSGDAYEHAFKVLRLSGGKVLLAPSLDLAVNAVREPNAEHIVAALGVLGANIIGMKAADMVMAALAGQAQMAQNIAIAKAAGVG